MNEEQRGAAQEKIEQDFKALLAGIVLNPMEFSSPLLRGALDTAHAAGLSEKHGLMFACTVLHRDTVRLYGKLAIAEMKRPKQIFLQGSQSELIT